MALVLLCATIYPPLACFLPIPVIEIVAEVVTYCVLNAILMRNLCKPVIPQHSFKVDEVM